MRRLLPILVTLAVLLGGAGEGWSADFEKGLAAARSGDFAAALREWKPLAEKGHARAQYDLGVMYRNGEGVPQDDVTTYAWFNLAATNGHALAEVNKPLIATEMTAEQIAKGQELSREMLKKNPKLLK